MRRAILKAITYVAVLITIICMCAYDTSPVFAVPILICYAWFAMMLFANRESLGIYEEN